MPAGVSNPFPFRDLNDLKDVNVPAPNDNDVLSWDVATGKWTPVAISVAVSLDAAYNEGATITVDDKDVIWNLNSPYDFKIQADGSDAFIFGNDKAYTQINGAAQLKIENTIWGWEIKSITSTTPRILLKPYTGVVSIKPFNSQATTWLRLDPYTGSHYLRIGQDSGKPTIVAKGSVAGFHGGKYLYIDTNIVLPKTNNVCDLGNAANRWKDLFLSGYPILTTHTPASAGAAGVAGSIAWDADYIYICIATDTWKRAAIAAW